MTAITVASPNAEFVDRVGRAYGGSLNGNLGQWLLEPTADPAVAASQLPGTAEVLVLGPDMPVEAALQAAAAVERHRPDVSVVIVAAPDLELWRRAVHAGAREVVAPDVAEAELRVTLDRAIEARRRFVTVVAPEPPQPSPTESSDDNARIIVVVSPKGGAGKTTISTNIAVGLAKAAPQGVVLVDLDVQFGDVGNALRLVPDSTIADAVTPGTTLDATAAKVFLSAHPSGCYALCAPESPAEADAVTPELASSLVELFASQFPYVVVDTGPGLDEHALGVIPHATDLVFVCSTDVPAVRGMRKELEALGLVGMTYQRRILVLNRADARVGLTPQDIEATVQMPIDVKVPSSRVVPVALNHGTPVLEGGERSPVSRALWELVSRFAEVPAPAPARRRWRRKTR